MRGTGFYSSCFRLRRRHILLAMSKFLVRSFAWTELESPLIHLAASKQFSFSGISCLNKNLQTPYKGINPVFAQSFFKSSHALSSASSFPPRVMYEGAWKNMAYWMSLKVFLRACIGSIMNFTTICPPTNTTTPPITVVADVRSILSISVIFRLFFLGVHNVARHTGSAGAFSR